MSEMVSYTAQFRTLVISAKQRARRACFHVHLRADAVAQDSAAGCNAFCLCGGFYERRFV